MVSRVLKGRIEGTDRGGGGGGIAAGTLCLLAIFTVLNRLRRTGESHCRPPSSSPLEIRTRHLLARAFASTLN